VRGGLTPAPHEVAVYDENVREPVPTRRSGKAELARLGERCSANEEDRDANE
jgi:hypothetical protein